MGLLEAAALPSVQFLSKDGCFLWAASCRGNVPLDINFGEEGALSEVVVPGSLKSVDDECLLE
jgi:hypothetical protein